MVNATGIDLSVRIGKLELPYPTFMGSGCYGSGEEFAPFVDLAQIGAVVLKSVTRLPRLGNPTPRLVHTPAGMLNAIGLQNPGIEWYLEHEVGKYASRPCAIVGSVAGFSVDNDVPRATKFTRSKSTSRVPTLRAKARPSLAIRI
jgi:dihydroorotate dehydrogenase (NAD+) catalytic subunit